MSKTCSNKDLHAFIFLDRSHDLNLVLLLKTGDE